MTYSRDDLKFSTLVDLLRYRALHQKNQLAFIFLIDGEIEGSSLTYQELDRQARAIAAKLQSIGIKGERSLLLYPPGLEFITAFFGCLYAGFVAVPANLPRANQSMSRLQAIVADAQVKVVLTTTSLLTNIESHLTKNLKLDGMHLLATDNIANDLASVWHEPTLEGDTLAFLQYTSGSTGRPKGVMVTHDNLLHNSSDLDLGWEHTANSVMVTWLPTFHDMGLIYGVLQPIYKGFRCYMMSPVSFLQKPLRWLQAISHYKATHSGAPNFAYALCAKKVTPEQLGDLDLSSWCMALNGAEPVKKEILEQFAETFKPAKFSLNAFCPGYGLAEATLKVTATKTKDRPVFLTVQAEALKKNRVVPITDSQEQARHLVGCGLPMLDTKIVIVNPETLTRCTPDEVGEIWVSGSSVAQGYWNCSELTENTFCGYLVDIREGPFLKTGDLGFLRNGELFVTGRIKDLIIIRGRNYYPQDIELTLEQSHSSLRPTCSAAFGVEVAGVEQLAIAVEVERTHLRNLDVEEVVGAIRQAVSEQHELQVYAVLLLKTASIPKTSSGKIQRHACLTGFLDGSLNVVETWISDYVRELKQRQDPVLAIPDIPSPSSIESLAYSNLHIDSFTMTTNTAVASSISKKRTDDLINWLRNYADKRINSRLIDERRCIPPYVVLDLGNRGILGMQVTENYGGLALSNRDVMRVIEQIAAIDLTLASFVCVNNILGIRPLQRYGTQVMRDELLPILAKGSEMAALAITEPGAGSNPRAISAQAIADGKGSWRLHGTKIWSGSASWAGVINIFVQLLDTDTGSSGITGFAVRQGTDGLRLGSEALTMGMRGMTQNAIYLEDVLVNPVNLIGELGSGMDVANDTFMFARLGIGAMSIGGMKRCAQLIHRYATRRSIATGSLLNNPVTLTCLSDLTAAITAVETLVALIANLLDEGHSVPEEAFVACKTSGPELLWSAADNLVQLLGGRGYLDSNGASQILRDARLFRIFEGPTETLNMYLGSRIIHGSKELDEFLSNQLKVPIVSSRLKDAAEQIKARCLESNAPFSDHSSALRWAYVLIGEVATYALLLAAVQRTANCLPSNLMSRTVEWTRLRFEQTITKALTRTSAESVLLNVNQTTELVSSYAETIGDLEQTLAGEDDVLDPLLRRNIADETPNKMTNSSTVVMLNNRVSEPSLKILTDDVELIKTWLTKWIANEFRLEPSLIDRHKPLTSYGLDSVTAISLVSDLEDWLKCRLSSNLAWDYPTIETLTEYVVKKKLEIDSSIKLTTELMPSEKVDTSSLKSKQEKISNSKESSEPFEGYFKIQTPLEPAFLSQRVDSFYQRMKGGNPLKGKIPGPDTIRLFTNDYLSLANHPTILKAQADELLENGNGLMMSGVYQPAQGPQRDFERRMAKFLEVEDVVVCQSGYCTNVGLLQSIANESTPIYIDIATHASLWEGIRSANAIVRPFKHNDPHHLEKMIQKYGSGVIAVDSVYSSNGSLCPLDEISKIAQQYQCVFVVDESHSLGIYGASGEGLVASLGLSDKVHFITASLSKAFCGRGGILAGSARTLEYFRYESRPAIFSSVVLPHEIAGFQKTLTIIEQEKGRRDKLHWNADYLRTNLSKLGYNVEVSESPIISLESGLESQTIILRDALESRGVFGAVYCTPATPLDGALVRFSLNSGLTQEQLDRTIEVCKEISDEVGLFNWESTRRIHKTR
ncbi:alpha-hydroxyketone-type quorum-sensing autoinducer synthase [Nostoc commune]|uniref:alpha-hydroxyketone-type quorum-sensing autoinducer synthase n=1 Tax=Nostoc commune TaxID=1178 RepID=UPI0018C67C38|nr:alpha-hydroxyketone-type quorum-sensing autoinducer synthase [Nostoc commune]MBG1260706.1 quorum-sensing autoinducer synthase [Nostoc commune BAE]